MSEPGSMIPKFDGLAKGYSAHDYADPETYGRRRVDVALALAGDLPPDAVVLDLACGDGNLAEHVLARGYRYHGVDGSAAMLAEARGRLGDAVPLERALIEEYEPEQPVDVTLCMRTVYLVGDRPAFFRRVAGYTRARFVFDFDPRALDGAAIDADLHAAGFERVVHRPFLLPQRVAVPAPLRGALAALEHTGPLARAALRVRGVVFCAATPSRVRT